MKYIIDTNSLINNPHIVEDKDVIVTSIVLRELEKLELKKMDRALQYSIRLAKRMVDSKIEDGTIELIDIDHVGVHKGYSENYADNIIIKFATEDSDRGIITDDILLKHKAMSMGVKVIPSAGLINVDDYEGLINFEYDSENEEHREIMEQIQVSSTTVLDIYLNPLNMKTNQYLAIWDLNHPTYKVDEYGEKQLTGLKELGAYKFNGKNMRPVKAKELNNYMFGNVSPRNVRQRMAFDLLQNEDITVKALFGVFGSGKDYLMLSHAIDQINKGKFDKIVWVRNNIEVRDTNSIGFLPDSLESKLKPFLAPLQDFLGGEEGLDRFIEEKKIEIQHLGFIRGRDIRNSIIYVTECQANTKEHIQLLLGRVGEGSQIWINGDDRQTDSRVFDSNNGVKALKKLAGEKLYGQVTMDKTERSQTARLAGLLD